MAHKLIGQILKEMELVNEGQIQEALAIQKKEGGAIGDILIRLGYITPEDLILALGAQMGMEVINIEEMEIPDEIIDMISPFMAKAYQVIPVSMEDNVLTVAMSNPHNINVIDDLRYMLKCEIKPVLATDEAIQSALDKYYAGKQETLGDVMKDFGQELGIDMQQQFMTISGQKVQVHNIEDLANSPPVVKLLNLILLHAIREHTSDIHFEPFEGDFKVRYRVDGVLYEMQSPPPHLALALTSRIKVMANLDISETRLPQDGRIMLSIAGKPVDLRVSTLPTMFGESVVLRVLDRSWVSLDLDTLGFRDDDLKLIKRLFDLPHGIIIVTGPTGCGKTTTLYSGLNYLNSPEWKIITTEDPVEYDLDGIIQCQINEDIGVTYANLLRTILRQDPDIILVGEIRDLETAQIAIEAALTGHLVLTTLHTNDAPSSITRLIDLGVEPFLACATLEAIIAQRLVRRICPKCKVEIQPTEEMLMEIGLRPEDIKGKKFCWGKGCSNCNNTGYKGRMAITEILLITDRIKELIMRNASTEQLRIAAREQGMKTLRDSGILAIYDGHTTIEEVVRETMWVEA
jgi:type IV pilus assembly protein PilB